MKTENSDAPRKRILLVDDERIIRESLKHMLAKDHNIVIEANNGAEAYTLFTKSKFDLVVTDFFMPFMSGDELAARIRQLAPRQPILMITGKGCKRGPRSPFNAVLEKPFDYGHLQQEIARLLKPVLGETEFLHQSPTTTAFV